MALGAGELGKLVVEIGANVEELQKGLNNAREEIKGFEGKTSVSLANVAKGFAFVGAAVVAALGGAIHHTIEFGEEINKLSQRTGIGVESLSKLRFVANQVNTSFEEVANGVKFLAKNIAEADTGTGEMANTFKILGIETRDVEGKMLSANAALLKLADKFALIDDNTQKTALAIQIFGRAGTAMIPILNLGSEGIEKLSKRAEELGVVLDEKSAEEISQFDDSMKELKAEIGGIALALGKNFIPALTATVDFIKTGVLPVIENLNALFRETGEILSKNQTKQALGSSDPVLENVQIELNRLRTARDSISQSAENSGGRGTAGQDQAVKNIDAQIERLEALAQKRRENFVEEQQMADESASAEAGRSEQTIAQSNQKIDIKRIEEEQIAAIKEEFKAASDETLQNDLLNFQALESDKTLIAKTETQKRIELLNRELEARATLQKIQGALQQAQNTVTAQGFSLLSALTTAFVSDSKAAAIALKAIRIGEIIIEGQKALSVIHATWAWNPPVDAALSTKQKISTLLGIATVAATSFATGSADVPEFGGFTHPGEIVVPKTFADSIREGDLSLGGPDRAGGRNNGGVPPVITFERIEIHVEGPLDDNAVPDIMDKIGLEIESKLRGAV